MIWRLALAGFLTVALAWLCLDERSHAQFNGCAAGFCGSPLPSSGGTYTGPLDAVSNASTPCWSLRACSAAVRGNASINVCNVSDVTCSDVLTDATTGSLPSSITIGGSSCASVTCTIKIIYDQITTLCAGPCSESQATISKRAVLTQNCINSTLWCATFLGSSSQCYSIANTVVPFLPFTISAVAKRTGAFTSQGYTFSTGGGNGFGAESSTNTWFMYNGTVVDFTASDSAWHSFQAIFSSSAGSSAIYVDGSGTTGINVGTGGAAVNPTTIGCWEAGTVSFFTGTFVEELSYPIAFTGTQATTLTTNQRSYWGF
jgi:hypothetical protein